VLSDRAGDIFVGLTQACARFASSDLGRQNGPDKLGASLNAPRGVFRDPADIFHCE